MPKTYIALDFETSGKERHYACSIGCAKIENNEIVDMYSHKIRPPSSNVWFTHIHGLTWKDLKDEPVFTDIWHEIENFIKNTDYLIAHNACFDRSVLYSCCEKFGLEKPPYPFLDTLKGSRKALGIDSHRLNIVCNYFGIEIRHHDAIEDALGCARVFLKLKKLGISEDDMRI